MLKVVSYAFADGCHKGTLFKELRWENMKNLFLKATNPSNLKGLGHNGMK